MSERKERERVERAGRITAAARRIAAEEGWNAVTIRRLAEEVEYSQPVLYSHFGNRAAIVAAVATDGFAELAIALREAARGSIDGMDAMRDVGLAYLDFACEHSALYEAMFTLPTSLGFADARTKPELREAFAALSAVVNPAARDAEIATEVMWAALHGLADLERSGRIRASHRAERLTLLVDALCKP